MRIIPCLFLNIEEKLLTNMYVNDNLYSHLANAEYSFWGADNFNELD